MIRYFRPFFGPGRSLQMKPSGARASSSSVTMKGRMAAWGQTKAHWLQEIQFSGIHSGTWMAAAGRS